VRTSRHPSVPKVESIQSQKLAMSGGLKLGSEGSTLCEATLIYSAFGVTVGNDANYSKLEGRIRFAAIAIGVLMFEHVPINRRRALLGAAGVLILQKVLRPMTASGETPPGSKVKIGVIGAGHIG
jgi:hypothetical protein